MARTKKTSTKRLQTNHRVPQNDTQANESLLALGNVQREIARLESNRDDELAAVKDKFEIELEPLREEADEYVGGLEMFANANRDRLTGNKSKTVKMANGVLMWRIRPPKVTLRGIPSIIAEVKRRRLAKTFLRTKEEIDKEAMLKAAEKAGTIPGVTIGSEGEDFVVEPFMGGKEAA